MDGDHGFCGSILGTEDFAEGASKIKNLFSQSNCHTFDRGNYRALREPCCLGNEDEWSEAAEWDFKINNWPYINAKDETVRECFYSLDKDSPQNLLKLGAVGSVMTNVVLLLTASLLSTALL